MADFRRLRLSALVPKFVILAASLPCLLACTEGSNFQGGGSSKKGKAPEASGAAAPQPGGAASADASGAQKTIPDGLSGQYSAPGPVKTLDEQLASQPDEAAFAEHRSQSSAEFFAQAEAAATNEPITIRGRTFENLGDTFAQLIAAREDFIARYPTMGEFYETSGIHSASDVTLEQIEAGLDLLEQANNSGDVERWLQQRSAARQSAGNGSDETLALLGDASCGIAIASAAGSYLGGIAACSASVGLACAGAGVSAAATTAAATQQCPPPPATMCQDNKCTDEASDELDDYLANAP